MVAALLLRGLDAFAAEGPGHHGKGRKLDGYLQQQASAGGNGDEQVIVTLKPGVKAKDLRKLQEKGLRFRGELRQGTVSGTLSRRLLRKLAKEGDVLNISHDSPVKGDGLVANLTGTALNSTFTLRRTLGIDKAHLQQPARRHGRDGGGDRLGHLPVARLRRPHRRLARLHRRHPPGSSVDAYGHGTHVAGTIGGAATRGAGHGARDVKLDQPARARRERPGHHQQRDPRDSVGGRPTALATAIDVINLSLGHPIYEPAASDPLVQAVEAAVRAGIIVVVSAGNVGRNPETGATGYGGIASPGNAPSAITVGAVRTQNTTRRTDDLVAEYISRGPSWYDAFAKPDVVAPGHRILARFRRTLKLYQEYPTLRGPNYNRGKQYLYLSGTSMAAAVTSGTVALMLESSKQRFGVKPSPNAVKAMLMASAFAMADADGAQYDTLTQGAGALNGGGALTLGRRPRPAAPGRHLVAGAPA